MTLDFIDLRGGDADRYTWTPFESSDAYDHPHWWDNAKGSIGDPWFVQVLENGVEVARAQLDDPGGINPAYTNVPSIGDERLEIQNIEVATAGRGRGIGARVVQALADRHPDRRLFAYSEGADKFWASLDWDRFDCPGRPPARALFIQPAKETDPVVGAARA